MVCDAACKGMKNAKAKEKWQLNVTAYFAPLHHKQVHEITTQDVLDVLLAIWLSIPFAAGEARGRLQKIFDTAAALGHRPKNERNIAELALLKPLLPKQPKKGKVRGAHPALPFKLLPAF
ncbi:MULTISPECIES: hypothetical protein [unclassified Bradyrhizobium]|uniref:phage integrase central domain-containing protein n=1 Tax=unclassified Bradyrhizobium TaxID=2631580 RepID=UPI0024792E9A|nr:MULTISPECIES: hypothetical protein [unclassified Bradyrhizobium]WGR72672.1 hypothetical protein MTX24_07030 [Bradyrhizobium sp. ISRA426]WGR77505.1 hypothetical protein MTX21_31980 [Bradyrhizobium sp. ISRA430]WGR87911.1 hypothetical protein MTX25_07030 [Bradyrhizobium sp. ISRA432]